ncbi:hypothetical protein OIV83_006061 [Microbotryomycetes sp. JL201]|nr:hypothetical protein OIV83_006061 [Microbotryomycetes sp. JL201]
MPLPIELLELFPSPKYPELVLDESRNADFPKLVCAHDKHPHHTALTRQATIFIFCIATQPERGDVAAFQRAREQRLATLKFGVVDDLPLPLEWYPSQPGALAEKLSFRRPVESVTRSGPTTHSVQLFHDDEADARLGHTAKRISFLQENHLSNAVQELVCIDTNSKKRNSRMPTTDTTVQRAIYRLTDRLVDALNPPVRWIQQRTNHRWFTDAIAPTRVRCTFSADAHLLDASDLDPFWLWDAQHEGEPVRAEGVRYRPIKGRERRLYFVKNVLDAHNLVPFSPDCVFVRRHHGLGDVLVFLTGHICQLDAFAHREDHFLRAVEVIESAALAISSGSASPPLH